MASPTSPSLPRQLARVHDFFDAVIRACILPFGPALVLRFLRTTSPPADGGHVDDPGPFYWAMVVVAFVLGRVGGSIVHATGLPFLTNIRFTLALFAALVVVVFSTGFVVNLEQLLVLRFVTGLISMVVWQSYGVLINQSNKEVATPRSATSSSDTSIINSSLCLGTAFGCLLGGVLYADQLTRPAIKPQVVVALLMACPLVISLIIHLTSRRCSRVRSDWSSLDTSSESGARARAGLMSSPPRSAMPEPFTSSPLGDIPSGLSIPSTFLESCKNNMDKARDRYYQTLRWRAEQGVDHILQEPQPHFDTIKQYYPHYLHGRSLRGELVVYEYPGRMDMSRLKRLGVGPKQLARHYTFMQEAMWTRLDAREEARVMTVLDIGGFSLTSLNKDVLDVMAATSEVMQKHYPERVTRIMVVNVPYFLGSAWGVVASVLPKSVQDRIIISRNPHEDLTKYISPDHIPRSYGGQSAYDLGESEEEMYLRNLVTENARRHHHHHNLPAGGGSGGGCTSSSSSSGSNITSPSLRPAAASTAGAGRGVATSVSSSSLCTPPPSLSRSSSSGGVGGSKKDRGRTKSWSWLNPFKTRATEAYLGYENRFVYDKVNQVWVLEEDLCPRGTGSESGDPRDRLPSYHEMVMQSRSNSAVLSPSTGRSTPAGGGDEEAMMEEDPTLVEEHGLVLAIQAAHWHTQKMKMEGSMQRSPGRGSSGSLSGRGGAGGVGVGAHPAAAHKQTFDFQSPRRPPSYLILQMVFLYCAWCGMQAAMEAMVPVWMLGSPHQGGLGAHPAGVGITLATVAATFVLFKGCGRHMRLTQLPTRSPLRAFRLGAGLLIATICAMSYHPASLEAPLFVRLVSHGFHTLILTLLVSSMVMARQAASALLYMVLKNTCTHPHYICNIAATLGEVPGPILGALVYSWSTEANLSYPMDTRLIFNLCALVSMGLYVLSLLLHVNVMGDFGISGEGGEMGGDNPSSSCRLLEDLLDVPVKDFNNLIDDTIRPSRRWGLPRHQKPV